MSTAYCSASIVRKQLRFGAHRTDRTRL